MATFTKHCAAEVKGKGNVDTCAKILPKGFDFLAKVQKIIDDCVLDARVSHLFH